MAIEAPSGGAWSVGANLPYTPSRGGLPSDARVEVTNLVASGLRIAAGGPTIVAVGYGGGLLQVNGTDYPLDVACAWTSTDGITWTAVPDGPALDRAEMLSVVYAKGEYLAVGEVQIAAGTDPSIPTSTDASVWTSPDGSTWTREPDAPAFADGVMQSVVAGGPGFVAVGTGSNGAASWTSPDGTTWTRAPDSPSLDDGAMHGVAAGPGGLVAVGFDGSGAIAWHSNDGITWSRDPTGPDFAGAQALSVAALGDRFVAVGGADPAGNPQAYVWLGD